MKTLIPSLLLLFLLFSACKKDKLEDDVPVTSSDEVIFGNPANMDITPHNITLEGFYKQSSKLSIDLDKDQVADVQLVAMTFGSPGLGEIPECSIECLNPQSQLLGTMEMDSTFYAVTKEIYTDSSSNKVYKVKTTYYSFYPQTAKDSVTQISEDFKLTAGNGGEKMKKDDSFYSKSPALSGRTLTFTTGTGSPDTVYVDVTKHIYTCDRFPGMSERYIGVKIIKNQVEKLGWIKVHLLSDAKIKIIESAIQK